MSTLHKTLGTALVTLSLHAFAGNCPALSGHFTIGKSESADFSSINEAANALRCGGVSGPVTFKLEKGTYNERVVFSTIPGVSAFNSVSFSSATGNNADAIISYSTSDATMILNGVSFISFENVTIDHQSAIYGNCMRVDGKSSNITFKSVQFDGVESARTGANNATVYFTSDAPKTNVTFQDCEINNGSIGIVKGGLSADARDARTSISGTLFYNQYESGLSLVNESAPFLSNNVVSSLSGFASFKAISLENISNCLVVRNNIINLVTGSIGLALNNCYAQITNMGEISNNSISVGGKDAIYGIYITGSTDNQILSFNRVKLSTNSAQNSTRAYYKNAGTGNNINILNNICYGLNAGGYTIIGNSYKDFFNQLSKQNDPSLMVSANGFTMEKVSQIK